MNDEELRMLQEYAAKMGLMNVPQPAAPPPVAVVPAAPPPQMLAVVPPRDKVAQKQILGPDPDQYWETLRLLAEDAKRKELDATKLQSEQVKANRTRGAK